MNNKHFVVSNWKFKACDEMDWMPAQVPGTVHTDLFRNGCIADPFYGINEHEQQWIDKKDWEYESTFELENVWLDLPTIEIVFEGLDTYADVTLNGKHVLSADNMFCVWRADVKPLLSPGLNKVTVRFRSPIAEDLPKLEKLGYSLPAANDQSELGGLRDRRISVFARKAPYHYGWDWGPRFVTSGIWREVRLEGWASPVIRDLYIRQDRVNLEVAELTAMLEIEAVEPWTGRLRVSTGEQVLVKGVALEPGIQEVSIALKIAEPALWWCRGLGDPNMYEFNVDLVSEDGRIGTDVVSIKTGLRDIKLVREKDEAGASFRFELNGIPLFAKGANHIPNDSFLTEVTAERYRHEIASAAESGMNMLRVWGGGIYEQDIFYDLCDEYGILVWQDFMFACSMYPGDEAFLMNVAVEAEHNIKRLRRHPCIALWCGNNEIDSAWSNYVENKGWGWKRNYTAEQREQIWADYESVFHDILPKAVARLADDVAYWASSPMRGLTGDENQHAFSLSGEGDIHYWGVWHASEPFANYNTHIGRFMSEFGFQSFPELDSVLKYAPESELALESEIMLAHQKNGRGNQLIKEYMDLYLPVPKDFKSFLYMSQVLQAEAIRTAIEAHRRNKPYCMGTLYWQMNDCWPVASWAGIDYYGRWKALQYTVRRSFRDIILVIYEKEDRSLAVNLVSDKREWVVGSLCLSLYNIHGELLKEETLQVDLAPDSVTEATVLNREQWLQSCEPRQVVLQAVFNVDGNSIDSKPYYFVSAKDVVLSLTQISVQEVTGSGGTLYTLQSSVLARQVWISAEAEGIFSDNYFDLIPGIPVTVEFRRRSNGEGAAFYPGNPGKLTVKSMADFV